MALSFAGPSQPGLSVQGAATQWPHFPVRGLHPSEAEGCLRDPGSWRQIWPAGKQHLLCQFILPSLQLFSYLSTFNCYSVETPGIEMRVTTSVMIFTLVLTQGKAREMVQRIGIHSSHLGALRVTSKLWRQKSLPFAFLCCFSDQQLHTYLGAHTFKHDVPTFGHGAYTIVSSVYTFLSCSQMTFSELKGSQTLSRGVPEITHTFVTLEITKGRTTGTVPSRWGSAEELALGFMLIRNRCSAGLSPSIFLK